MKVLLDSIDFTGNCVLGIANLALLVDFCNQSPARHQETVFIRQVFIVGAIVLLGQCHRVMGVCTIRLKIGCDFFKCQKIRGIQHVVCQFEHHHAQHINRLYKTMVMFQGMDIKNICPLLQALLNFSDVVIRNSF